MYWAVLEVELSKSEIVYQNKDGLERKQPQLPNKNELPLKKAS
jgi:hypothetical protein